MVCKWTPESKEANVYSREETMLHHVAFLLCDGPGNTTSVVQVPTHVNNYLQVPNGSEIFSSQWLLGGHCEVGGRQMIAMKSLPSSGSSH